MLAEAEAIRTVALRLDGRFAAAVERLAACPGKIVTSGVGKSGRIAEKLAATLRGAGSPAVYLHPGEAPHGDLGIYSHGDASVLVSKSGTTRELLALLPALRERSVALIAIVGDPDSPLAQAADVVLDASVEREADPHNLAPTSSAAAAMALGDALALALMGARQFTPAEFARTHPGGRLGWLLGTHVSEVMHTAAAVAWVAPEDPVKQVIVAMTERPLGCACVLHPDRRLAGLITDGDLRRALQSHDDIRSLSAAAIMTRTPSTIAPEATLHQALREMEERPRQISVLPVVTGEGCCAGVIRLHDLYRRD
ncbi:MAG: KpsF/GutQ family sugar-phosphate isomerase [Bryobacterales bacterium]|nr:KpsF/GutQ family sugar-phosphate isomerase [Bryobacterales bacterium]